MHFLVHHGVLLNYGPVQLAHANRFVQVRRLWRVADTDANSDTHSNPDPDSYANTDSYANPDAYANTDAYPDPDAYADSGSERAE